MDKFLWLWTGLLNKLLHISFEYHTVLYHYKSIKLSNLIPVQGTNQGNTYIKNMLDILDFAQYKS